MRTEDVIRRLRRLSDSFLEDFLDTLDPISEVFKTIDSELNRRAEILTKAQKRAELEESNRKTEFERRLSELQDILSENSERHITLAMVLEFGEAFRDDYYIDPTFTVHSLVTNKFQRLDDLSKWEFASIEDARKKVETLIYYRVYDHYFRGGPTSEDLIRLKCRIAEILRSNE